MKDVHLDYIVHSIKKIINDEHNEGFDKIAIDVYQAHYAKNYAYYKICGKKYPSEWEKFPLIETSNFNIKNENYACLEINTMMPFPGVLVTSEDSLIYHFMRDTELYKLSIAKSFQTNVLQEASIVPWVNLQVAINKDSQNTASSYAIHYLFELFRNENQSLVFSENSMDALIESYGEENKVTVPTVFLIQDSVLQDVLNLRKNEIDYNLPLGSNIVIVQNHPNGLDNNMLKTVCETFDVNKVTIMLCLSEASTPFYATIKKINIDAALKYDKQVEHEFFVSPWVRARIINTETNEDAKEGKLVIYDLANFWSCPFILTEYCGRIGQKGGLIINRKSENATRVYS